MASVAPRLLTKESLKFVMKAGGGRMRPAWNTGRTNAVGQCGGLAVTGDYKTGRTLAETPKANLARACVTPAAVPAKSFGIGSRRISFSAASTAITPTARTAAAAAPTLRTAAAAVSPVVTAPRACASYPVTAARKVPRTTAASASATTTTTTSAAAIRRFVVSASAAPNRTASAVASAVAAPRASTSSPAAAATKTARTSPASSTACMGASAASTRTATAATSSSCSSSGNSVPVGLDTVVMKLKGPKDEWDSSVWMARLDEREVVVKQTPFHSSQRAGEIEALWGKQRAASIIITEKKARHEAATVVRMKGIFVQPLLVLEREYTRRSSSNASCPDREIITVLPYYPSGDAAKYIEHMATPLIAAFKAGKRSLDSVVKELVGEVTRFAEALFLLVSQVHQKGFILIDHKLENMVYDAAKSRWLLIDAGEVQGCVLRSKLMGKSLCAPLYAAPEQEQGKCADSRSDVFTCGKCIHVAVGDCMKYFEVALGDGTDAFEEADAAFKRALLGLKEDVLQPCCASKPTARPSAAAVVCKLRGPRHQQ